MSQSFDFVVIGGGIAGVSVAYQLAEHGRVCLLERERQLAYHTTGRSAAISMESYGNQHIRALTCASRGFFEAPPAGLASTPLWSPRGALIVATHEREAQLRHRFEAVRQHVPDARWADAEQVMALAPYLAPGRWSAGLHEPGAFDLDVHAIHGAYLTGLRQRGGEVRRDCELFGAQHRDGVWRLLCGDGSTLHARLIVNAAGSWADTCAERCEVPAIGLQALRRTVLVVDPHCEVHNTPYLGTLDEDIFIKPEAGRLIVSPCDETPSAPCDAQPEELDLAITLDRLEQATQLRPKRIVNRWAGLRNFVADRTPVVGADPRQPAFVWLAALGGYGIQTAPALSRLCCHSALGLPMPADLAERGLDYAPFSPERCRSATFATRRVTEVAQLH